MNKYDQMFVHELEKRHMIIKPSKWESCGAPSELLETAKSMSIAGVEAAIAFHPEEGWFGMAQGQGSSIWWWNDDVNNEME